MRRGIVLLSILVLLISMSKRVAAQAEGVVTVSVIGVAALSENEAETKIAAAKISNKTVSKTYAIEYSVQTDCLLTAQVVVTFHNLLTILQIDSCL